MDDNMQIKPPADDEYQARAEQTPATTTSSIKQKNRIVAICTLLALLGLVVTVIMPVACIANLDLYTDDLTSDDSTYTVHDENRSFEFDTGGPIVNAFRLGGFSYNVPMGWFEMKGELYEVGYMGDDISFTALYLGPSDYLDDSMSLEELSDHLADGLMNKERLFGDMNIEAGSYTALPVSSPDCAILEYSGKNKMDKNNPDYAVLEYKFFMIAAKGDNNTLELYYALLVGGEGSFKEYAEDIERIEKSLDVRPMTEDEANELNSSLNTSA